MSGEGGSEEDQAPLDSNGKVSMDPKSGREESIGGVTDNPDAKDVDCSRGGVLGISLSLQSSEEKKISQGGESCADTSNGPSEIDGDDSVDQKDRSNGFDPYDMLPKGKGSILCRFCRKDLGHGCRIRCAQCDSFDLCLACFSAGIKLDWMASDELKLLDAVQRYGMGNWDDMSVQVFNKSKSAKQIREHYLDDYFGTFGSVLPLQIFKNEGKFEGTDSEFVIEPLPATEDPSIPHFGKKVNSNFLATESMADIDNWRRLEEQRTQSERPASPDDVSMTQSSLVNEGGEGVVTTAGMTQITSDQQEEENSNTLAADDSSARSNNTIKDKNSSSDSSICQRNVKSLPGYSLVGYMPLRGDFDTEYDQDAEQILADLEFSDSDEPCERQLKLDVIAIYNKRLDERQCRKDFVVDRKLLDYKHIQMEERRRPADERELVARMRVLARFHSREDHDALVENVVHAKRLRSRIEKLQGYKALGLCTFSEVEAYEGEKERKTEQLRGGSALSDGGNGNVGWNSNISGGVSKSNWPWSSTQIEGWGSDASADMNSAVGEELLSQKEKELCAALGLLPRQYLVTKAAIVKESATQGFVDRKSARRLVRLDVKQVDSAFDFFVSCGWISSGPPPDTSQNENRYGSDETTVQTPMDTL